MWGWVAAIFGLLKTVLAGGVWVYFITCYIKSFFRIKQWIERTEINELTLEITKKENILLAIFTAFFMCLYVGLAVANLAVNIQSIPLPDNLHFLWGIIFTSVVLLLFFLAAITKMWYTMRNIKNFRSADRQMVVGLLISISVTVAKTVTLIAYQNWKNDLLFFLIANLVFAVFEGVW